MTKKEIIPIAEATPALTDKQLARLIDYVKLTPAECAKHPRTKHGYYEERYAASMQSYKGFALLRYYIIEFCVREGVLVSATPREVMRFYYEADGRRHIFARPCRPLMAWRYDYDKPLRYVGEPRDRASYGRAYQRTYVSCDTFIFSCPQFLRQRGYNTRVPSGFIQRLFTPRGECYAKWGMYDFLGDRYRPTEEMFTAIRIAHRHGYRIDDAGLYLDYLRDLIHYNLDLHNPHYVCPADLRAAHTALTERRHSEYARVQAEAERKRAVRQLREARGYEKQYAKRLHSFLGIVLQADGITIRPLQSVAEFFEEGQAMHHCVFACGYYKKANTLIFSARDSEGRRLATIEYNYKTGEIIQCRAACNAVPEQDAAIRSLILNNRNSIINPIKKAAA